jgi:LmbE family N-acetylglucosaminyl deacetylase
MTAPPFDAVYLSPHLDDAVLSCGGRIHDLAAQGRAVLVVTVGAGDEPEGQPSRLAGSLHRAWRLARPGAGGEGVVARRRAEDEAACALLGASVVHWDLLEAIYRRDPATGEPFYGRLEDLFGPLPPGDRPTILAVVERLAALPAHRELYAPLAVGGHVDHRIVRMAAEQRFGSSLVYYEEYPYGRTRREVRRVVRGVGWRSEVLAVSAAGAEAKVRAVAAYRSQVRPLFGGRLRLGWKVRHHLRGAGGERIWWWEP